MTSEKFIEHRYLLPRYRPHLFVDAIPCDAGEYSPQGAGRPKLDSVLPRLTWHITKGDNEQELTARRLGDCRCYVRTAGERTVVRLIAKRSVTTMLIVCLAAGCSSIQPIEGPLEDRANVMRQVEPGDSIRITTRSGETFDITVRAIDPDRIPSWFSPSLTVH